MKNSDLFRSLKYGLVAGLISTLIMDTVSLVIFLIIGESLPDFFALLGESFLTFINLEVEYPLWQGLVLHYSIGMITGLALGGFSQLISSLNFNTYKKGILACVIVTEIVGAMLFFLMSVILSIGISDMTVMYGLGSILHLFWGTCLGVILTFGQRRKARIPQYAQAIR